MEWMILPLKRYFDFSGRSRRKEYWLFTLFIVLASFVVGILDSALGLTFGETEGASSFRSNNGVLGTIFSLATLIPSISVGVRRLHDVDRTGWWLLFPLITTILGVLLGGLVGGFGADGGSGGVGGLGGLYGVLIGGAVGVAIGGIVLLVFYCTGGTRGPNRFGSDPKDPVGDVAEVFR
jgi:uncharacterized membrane protein YhaH (DUF805 family)